MESNLQNKIPKIIHYVWVGGKEKPKQVLDCIETWKKFCPDYEIKEWNESNFDINSNVYVKEAYESKKYAFVSDYIRLYAIYNYGGIYMDTDVELIKNLDEFLIHRAFSGFENCAWIPTAVMGGEKNHPWFKLLLDYYIDRHFIVNGKPDLTTNVIIIGALTKINYSLKINNQTQELENGLVFYSNDYFCPKNYVSKEIKLTENTCAIHHFAFSWGDGKSTKIDKFLRKTRKILGKKIFEKIENRYMKKQANKNYKRFKKNLKNKK